MNNFEPIDTILFRKIHQFMMVIRVETLYTGSTVASGDGTKLRSHADQADSLHFTLQTDDRDRVVTGFFLSFRRCTELFTTQ